MSFVLRNIAIAAGFLIFSTSALAATTAQIDDARTKGLAWLVRNQVDDGSWKVRLMGSGLHSTHFEFFLI